jgi:BlaI family transcriptional regulator, penicillinase repressor
MKLSSNDNLSKREQQIMDIVYRKGKATAAEVMDNMQDPPSYSAVRALMSILEKKGYLGHSKDGLRYVFTPAIDHDRASQNALRKILDTFFNNSVEEAVTALIDIERDQLSDEACDRLLERIKEARKAEA